MISQHEYLLDEVSHAGSWGWLVLAAGVAAWDLCAKETLSAAFDRGLDNRMTRPLVLGAMALTGSHLAGMIPEQYDPFVALSRVAGKLR